jgi:5-methyltetrahydrofolate--homocysteine methyltransferase
MHTVLSSATKTVTIGDDVPFVIIGERLNPTGRKLFQEKLRADDLSTINIDVADQVAGGCDMLDVNMGVPLTDEPALLAKAIKLVQSLTDLPICIDSSVIEALDAGLAVYEGKALVNSMTGEDERMDIILPLVKKYDAAILALPNDEIEIPMLAKDRMVIVEKIVRRVEKEGISLENLLIDPLAMPMGLTSAIMDGRTPEVVQAVRAADLLLGLDQWGANWITNFRANKEA